MTPVEQLLATRALDMATHDGVAVSPVYLFGAANQLQIELLTARDRLMAIQAGAAPEGAADDAADDAAAEGGAAADTPEGEVADPLSEGEGGAPAPEGAADDAAAEGGAAADAAEGQAADPLSEGEGGAPAPEGEPEISR